MIQRIRQSMKDGDKGFTLVELLVVVIIIGILASVAIPVFLGQRQRAYDAAVQSDMKSFATAAETSFASNLTYPSTAQGFATNGATTPIKSAGTEYIAWVDTTGNDAGYIIYGHHTSSDKIFVISSYNGGAPTGSTGTTLPTAPPTGAALTGLGAPAGATLAPAVGVSW